MCDQIVIVRYSNMTKYRIPVFSIDKIPAGSNILIVGRRGVGKSYLCTELLMSKPSVLPVVFASKYVVDTYKKKIPEGNVLESFDGEVLEAILSNQVQSKGETGVIMAFDDVTHENACLMENMSVRDIVKYGSSLNITSIFSVQHAGVYDDTFRRNVDYVFAFHDNLTDNKKLLYNRYGDMFNSYEEFDAIFKHCTAEHPYRCLVLDMKNPWHVPVSVSTCAECHTKTTESHTVLGKPKNIAGTYWYTSTHENLSDNVVKMEQRE